MIDLYGMGSPNVLKVVLMLEELELPYRFHLVKVWTGGQFEPEFVKLNPNSRVPVIVDPDGPDGAPITVWESGAILTYLAEKAGALLPARGAARYDVLQWMMLQMTGIGPIFGQFVHFTRHQPGASDYAEDRYRSESVRLLDVVEARLGEAAYLGGAQYSIADVATYPWFRLLKLMALHSDARTNTARWMADIAARPAAQRLEAFVAATAAEGQADRASATDDDRDRIFRRGRYARAV